MAAKVPPEPPAEYKIRRFADLEPNWDTYGAPAIDPGAIREALRVLGALETLGAEGVQAVPTSLGGVFLEGELGEAWFEVEILPREADELPSAEDVYGILSAGEGDDPPRD